MTTTEQKEENKRLKAENAILRRCLSHELKLLRKTQEDLDKAISVKRCEKILFRIGKFAFTKEK
jgi:hypothetical protein